MQENADATESRRTVLKKSAAGASAVAGGVIASSGSAAALDTDLLEDTDFIEIGDLEVDVEELDVLAEGDGSGSERVTVEGRGEYAFVLFAEGVTVEYGNVEVTVADTSVSDSRAIYVEGSVDADSDVDAKQYVEFVVEGVEMIASDVLGTDVDVFLDADEEGE